MCYNFVIWNCFVLEVTHRLVSMRCLGHTIFGLLRNDPSLPLNFRNKSRSRTAKLYFSSKLLTHASLQAEMLQLLIEGNYNWIAFTKFTEWRLVNYVFWNIFTLKHIFFSQNINYTAKNQVLFVFFLNLKYVYAEKKSNDDGEINISVSV